MEDTRMKKHVTVVGAIHIGFGFFGLIGALAVFFALNFARGFVEGDEIPSMVLGFLSVSLPLLVGFMSSLGLAGVSGFCRSSPGRVIWLLLLQHWAASTSLSEH